MISNRWLEKRRGHWTRLEQLVDSSGRGGVSALSPAEIQELALLYRQTASDLSTVREDPTGGQLSFYLNRLLGRAHNLIYMGRKAKAKGIWIFFRDTYPAIFRETFPDTFLAFTLFFAAAVGAFLIGMADPIFTRYFLGPQMIDTIEHHKMWTDSIVTIKPLASSGIMTNNLSVSLTTFALGITAGIGTAWMMILNGLLFGVVNAACWREGMLLPLWSFVAGHGVLELPAIFIAGGAGFGIARGLLFPGTLPRRVSLVRAGARSVRLVVGIIPMLVVAGTIEGFISPSPLHPAVKFTLAAALFTMLVLYLTKRTPKSATGAALTATANR
ncbi:MAG TPA: stage II sporulation protein M [Candidatus Limnocylindrales bacterium]|nr:stage II sporulation protein M [Candidatus Limnocylindrales bacterium]